MTYTLKTYLNGQCNGSGEYDELYDAIATANDALHLASYPIDVDEFEVTTDYKKRQVIVAYGYSDDRAIEVEKQDEIVSFGEAK